MHHILHRILFGVREHRQVGDCYGMDLRSVKNSTEILINFSNTM